MIKSLMINIPLILYCSQIKAQTIDNKVTESKEEYKIIEIRSYNLKQGTRNDFEKIFTEQSLPLLDKWNIEVVAYGPSQHDENSWFLIRSYKNEKDRLQSEDSFYGSDDWNKGPKQAVLSLIINYTTIVQPSDSLLNWSKKIKPMTKPHLKNEDCEMLSALNAQFIKNFINHDAKAHSEIIHKDFVCIESNGDIVGREEYLKNWPASYANSGYVSFGYKDEWIRVFGDIALVRSKTEYIKKVDGKEVKGNSVYTDTYFKENGKWLCVQAQITPVN
jgi:ketosteroid isomerase-like protein